MPKKRFVEARETLEAFAEILKEIRSTSKRSGLRHSGYAALVQLSVGPHSLVAESSTVDHAVGLKMRSTLRETVTDVNSLNLRGCKKSLAVGCCLA